MPNYIPLAQFGTVADLEGDLSIRFLCDSQDVASIKKMLGENADEFDSFFMQVSDGEYTAAYGMNGIVPYLDRPIFRLL